MIDGQTGDERIAAARQYVKKVRTGLACLHCGAKNTSKSYTYLNRESGGTIKSTTHSILWHHPDGDGHLGRVHNKLVQACATIAEIDAEIARCVPLCHKCHVKEHARMREVARMDAASKATDKARRAKMGEG